MKKAVCVGINYAGTELELRGCVNDADAWARLFGASQFDVAILAERAATRSAILDSLGRLVKSLKPGDTGAFTFSGHGTWVPDKDGDEPDGRDEALCPIDMGDDGANLILDDELSTVFRGIAPGAHLLLVTDSCHSGTVYRMGGPAAAERKVRFVPPSHFLRDQGLVSRMDRAFGQPAKKANDPLPWVVHFSGCKDSEYSNDAMIGGRFCGAFSHYAVKAFGRAVALGLTYADVHKEVRRNLPGWEFQQTPQLNATAADKKLKVFG